MRTLAIPLRYAELLHPEFYPEDGCLRSDLEGSNYARLTGVARGHLAAFMQPRGPIETNVVTLLKAWLAMAEADKDAKRDSEQTWAAIGVAIRDHILNTETGAGRLMTQFTIKAIDRVLHLRGYVPPAPLINEEFADPSMKKPQPPPSGNAGESPSEPAEALAAVTDEPEPASGDAPTI